MTKNVRWQIQEREKGEGQKERQVWNIFSQLTIHAIRGTNAGNVAEWWRKIVASKKTMRASGERRDRTERKRRAEGTGGFVDPASVVRRGAENWILVGVMETSRIMTGCLAPRPR